MVPVQEYVRKHTALENEIRTVLQVPPEDHDLEMLRRIFDQARSTNIQIDALEELQLVCVTLKPVKFLRSNIFRSV